MMNSNQNKRPASLAAKDTKSQKVIQPINLMVGSANKGYLSSSPISAIPPGVESQSSINVRDSDQQQNGMIHQINNYKNQHINSHSAGRDLGAMGLITQVKQGEEVPTVVGINGHNINYQQNYSPLAQKHYGIESALENQQTSINKPLLRPQRFQDQNKKTLVLDLDETLVHSSFKPPKKPDIVLPVDIEGRICHVYVLVRPGCVKFLNEMSKYFEVVIYTASLSKYADPLMDILDANRLAPQRLFREHCTFYNGLFVKDLSRLGRKLSDTIIIDNSPQSYMFQPENGIPILSWYEDRDDTKLLELIPALKLLSQVNDVRPIILESTTKDNKYICEKSIKLSEKVIKEMQPTVPPPQSQFSHLNSQSNVPHLMKTEDSCSNVGGYGVENNKINGLEDFQNRTDFKKLQNLNQQNINMINANKNKMGVPKATSVDDKLKVMKHTEGVQENSTERSTTQNYSSPDKKMINTWVGGFQDTSGTLNTEYNKHSQTPQQQQSAKQQDLMIQQYNLSKAMKKDANDQQVYQSIKQNYEIAKVNNNSKTRENLKTSTTSKRLKDGAAKSQVSDKDMIDDQNKKRPKTASKDTHSQVRNNLSDKIMSGVLQTQQSQANSHQKSSFAQIQMNDQKKPSNKQQIIVNSQQINLLTSKEQLINNPTPQHISSKLTQIKKSNSANRGTSSNSTNTSSNIDQKKNKPSTAQISNRSSVEREKESKKGERVTSSKKKLHEEIKFQQQTPYSQKNYIVSTFLTNMNKNQQENLMKESQSPIQAQLLQSQGQQFYTSQSQTSKMQQLETPPSKNQVGLVNKFNQQAYSPMIINNKYSSQKKTSKPSSSQDTKKSDIIQNELGQEQQFNGGQQEGRVNNKHQASESTRNILGQGNSRKSPGKIFNFSDKNGKANGNQANVNIINANDKYSTLLKNQGPGGNQQLKESLSKSNGVQEKREFHHQSYSQQQQQQSLSVQSSNSKEQNIKGVKLINNQNSLLVNKYTNVMQQPQLSNTYQFDKDYFSGLSSTKNPKINNMLIDYEKQKAFNQELLLKNMGSPKGPIYARSNGGKGDEIQQNNNNN